MKANSIKVVTHFIAFAGILLSIYTFVGTNYFRSFSVDLRGFAVWSSIPYLIYWFVASKIKSRGAILGGGIVPLGIAAVIHAKILYFDGSLIDAAALISLPFWQLFIIMPAGFLFGWLIEKLIYRITNKREQNFD